jgi:hypothetical protein
MRSKESNTAMPQLVEAESTKIQKKKNSFSEYFQLLLVLEVLGAVPFLPGQKERQLFFTYGQL